MVIKSSRRIMTGALISSLALFLYTHAKAADCDLERGQKVFAKCQSCHTLDNSGTHLAGPNLYGILGQQAGSVAGYQYSRGMRKSNLTWDTATLHQFLESPQRIVPRTKMAFAGLKQIEDRNAVICHLSHLSNQDPALSQK